MQGHAPYAAIGSARVPLVLQTNKGRRRQAAIVVTVAIVVMSAPLASVGAGGRGYGSLQLAQASGTAGPSILVASSIVVEPAKQTPLPIQIGNADPTSLAALLLVVKGLPPTISLTKGHALTAGTWVLPVMDLSSLAINVPMDVAARSELMIGVMGRDGKMVAEVRTTLIIAPAPLAAAAKADPKVEPAPSSVPPQATIPPLTPADRQSAEKMVVLGERELELGNIARARLFLLRAAQMGLARGALLLATTYDPRDLARMRAVAVQPDLAEARKWYDRARELGAPEAVERLSRLQGR